MSKHEWQDGDLRQIYYAIQDQTDLIREWIESQKPQPKFAVGDQVVPAGDDTRLFTPKTIASFQPDPKWRFIYTFTDGSEWSEHNIEKYKP